jgi:hypothetical protein
LLAPAATAHRRHRPPVISAMIPRVRAITLRNPSTLTNNHPPVARVASQAGNLCPWATTSMSCRPETNVCCALTVSRGRARHHICLAYHGDKKGTMGWKHEENAIHTFCRIRSKPDCQTVAGMTADRAPYFISSRPCSQQHRRNLPRPSMFAANHSHRVELPHHQNEPHASILISNGSLQEIPVAHGRSFVYKMANVISIVVLWPPPARSRPGRVSTPQEHIML